MKISILYFSKTGKTREMAEMVAAGARTVPGTDIRLFELDKIDPDYLNESCAVIFGTPTYYANTCWQIKKWLTSLTPFAWKESWARRSLQLIMRRAVRMWR